MNKPTIKVYFRWNSLQPDRRQWKPSNPLLEPIDIMVVVDVPKIPEYVANVDDIDNPELQATVIVDPVLTPKGMRYCIDQIEREMSDDAPAPEKADDNEEWETIDEEDKWE